MAIRFIPDENGILSFLKITSSSICCNYFERFEPEQRDPTFYRMQIYVQLFIGLQTIYFKDNQVNR